MRNIVLFFLVVISAALSGFAYFDVSSEASPSAAGNNPKNDYSQMSVRDITKDREILGLALQESSVKSIMDRLVAESNGGTIYDCHQEAHNIGRIGYKIYKEKAFGECDASCHSGCYHGAMESFLNEKGTVDLASNIKSVCDLFETSFGRFECLHGVGHGLLAYVDYDLPETVLECKKLEEWFSIVSCYGGMFMENVLTGQGLGASEDVTHETEWVNYTDPHFPCNALDKSDYDLIYQCYQMQTSWMLTIYNFDFQKVRDACLKASENMISVCFKSFGRDAAGNSLRNPASIIKTCGMVPKTKDYHDQCIIGGVNVIIDFWGPALKNQATELCAMAKEEEGKPICYSTLISRLGGLLNERDKKEAICSAFEEKYKNNCLATL